MVPYPPGFPILVPGQLVSPQILEFMRKLDVKEVHGYRPELGLAVFTAEALERGSREPDRGAGARFDEDARPGCTEAARRDSEERCMCRDWLARWCCWGRRC